MARPDVPLLTTPIHSIEGDYHLFNAIKDCMGDHTYNIVQEIRSVGPYHCDRVEGVEDGEEEDVIFAITSGATHTTTTNEVSRRGSARHNAIR